MVLEWQLGGVSIASSRKLCICYSKFNDERGTSGIQVFVCVLIHCDLLSMMF